MRFTYYYKTSDNMRHEAEISAPGRDEAFAALRERGIRPIKLVALSSEPEAARGSGRRYRRIVPLVLVVLSVLLAWIAWMLLDMRGNRGRFYKADGTIGAAAGRDVAIAMTRRQIVGDRAKIDDLLANGARFVFKRESEAYLARFAQPGRSVPPEHGSPLAPDDLIKSLSEPIYTYVGEMAECVELKRIVAGMKEEFRMFLASGGTAKEYLGRLEQRQNMECAHLAKAKAELAEKLEQARRAVGAKRREALDDAYVFWRDTNAWLGTMGIETIAIPVELSDVEAEHASEESQTITSAPVAVNPVGFR